MNSIPIRIIYQGMLLQGDARVIKEKEDPASVRFVIHIQGWLIGTLRIKDAVWMIDQPIDPEFVAALGRYISNHIRAVTTTMS